MVRPTTDTSKNAKRAGAELQAERFLIFAFVGGGRLLLNGDLVQNGRSGMLAVRTTGWATVVSFLEGRANRLYQ